LVANPFLALFWLIAVIGLVRLALEIRNLFLAGVALCGLAALKYLLQYHCLDCGSSGRLFRWDSHACPSVVARRQSGQVRRLRGPNPVLQTIVWGYLLAGLAILAAALLLAIRAATR
jgi:hypothetical protein